MELKNVMQSKNKLPLDFINEIYHIFNPRIADKILSGMTEKRITTLRVNRIKYNMSDLMKYFDNTGIEYEKVSWYGDALIIKNANENNLQQLDIYKSGYIYIQSLSSMLPPIILNPKKGEKVLDLTAAPGSKTTELAAIMNNDGYILANEIDKIRADRLKYNITHQGASIANVQNKDGVIIGNEYPEFFDKVLLDTPCSGEGRFLLEDAKTYKNWSTYQVEKLVNLQKRLFESAIKALKSGGEMVYSTCTLNKKENEEILNWAIEKFKIELLDIDIKINDSIKGFSKGYNEQIKKAVRILPNIYQEGFFVAKILKK